MFYRLFARQTIEERAEEIAYYIIETGSTVRQTARNFGVSKSTVHMEVTQKNGWKERRILPESIEIRKVFLAERNPIMRFEIIIK